MEGESSLQFASITITSQSEGRKSARMCKHELVRKWETLNVSNWLWLINSSKRNYLLWYIIYENLANPTKDLCKKEKKERDARNAICFPPAKRSVRSNHFLFRLPKKCPWFPREKKTFLRREEKERLLKLGVEIVRFVFSFFLEALSPSPPLSPHN